MFTVAGLYAIADTCYLDPTRLVSAVTDAIAGGARIIQYRDKSPDSERREREARSLAAVCRENGKMFLINDDVGLAAKVGADGVHLGRDDTTIGAARERLGPDTVVGVSCYNELARALAAQAQGADYIALGSFFPSRTKPQAVRAGLELLHAARAKIRLPIVAIGGITPENGAELIAAGADALAVIQGIFGQSDVAVAAKRYAQLFAGAIPAIR